MIPCFVLPGGPGFDTSYFRPYLNPLKQVFSLYPIDYSQQTLDGVLHHIHYLQRHTKQSKAIFLGHSAGGMLALEYALRYPDEVSGLILVSTAADNSFTQVSEQNIKHYPEVLKAFSAYVKSKRTNDDYKASTLAYIEFAVVPEKQVEARAVFEQMKYNAACLEQLKRNFIPYYNINDLLHNISVPALVIAGEQDVVIPPQFSEHLARHLPHAEFSMIPNTNHFPFLENPDAFCATVMEWVRKTF
ncbi:MAG: alpha/beta hydrolase [Deltaproteobacteria bacterium]|nr:alpha/beta hydrolase [Deltaproteobacteria bacterium]